MNRTRWLGLLAMPLVSMMLIVACADEGEPEEQPPAVETAAGGGLVSTPTESPTTSGSDSSPSTTETADTDATPTGTVAGAEPTGTTGGAAADFDAWQAQMEELAADLDFEVTGVDLSTDGLIVGTTLTQDQAADAEQICDTVQGVDLGGMARVVIEGDDGSTLVECEL